MDDSEEIPDWAKQIGIRDEGPRVRVNITQGCLDREMGNYGNRVPNEFLWAAEDRLINKTTYDELKCQLPDSPRSTFLMVFSPDGKKVASTHGNHNVYVTDLTTGKNIQTLSGHPRTPWCIAFHPSSNQILASGCLAGQVRVWDLHGGSEVWTAESQSVIASLAFHPVDRMLVIATYNELHFWDWSQAKPFAKCSTKSEKEKVRYVSFDRLGNKLITGIANPVNTPPQWERVNVVSTQPTVTTSATATTTTAPSTTAVATTSSSSQSQTRAATLCENYLLNQYSQLVRRYLDLSRSRITQTMDRGTDPMDLIDGHRSRGQGDRPRHGPMPSSSHANGCRSVRYRIMRSTCRSYRPPSSRERFRIHSSLLSGLPSRSSPSSNSLVRTTTTTTTSSQSIIFTTIGTSSDSSSTPEQLPRVRQCGIGFIARPVCVAISRENSPSSSPSARPSQPAQSSQSGAVTNPTYTPYSDRSISSSRESNSGDSERSRFPMIRPYRILFDDINQIRASVQSMIRTSSMDENVTRTTSSEPRFEVVSPLDRRDRLRSQLLDVEEVDTDRDVSRSLTYVSPFRRLSSDSESTSTTPTNTQRPSPQHWVSYNTNHLPLYPRPVPRFQVRPTFDMNNTSPVRRVRDNTDSDTSSNTTPAVDTPSSTPTSSPSPSPVQLNAGPVPRLQIRPRYLQDQSQLTNQSDNQSPGLQSNQILRRQFVLSRHSNSPFQPRVPHVVQNSGPVTTATNSTSNADNSTSTAASVITTAARPNSTPANSTSAAPEPASTAARVISTVSSSTSTVASVICTAIGPASSAASTTSTSAAVSVISTVASSNNTATSVICAVAGPTSTAAPSSSTFAAASVITTAPRLTSAAVSSTSNSNEASVISMAERSTSTSAATSVITTAARSASTVPNSTSTAASVITTAARSASTVPNSTSTAASVITTAARSASTVPNSTSTAASVITTAARSASSAPNSTSTSTAANSNSTSTNPGTNSTSTTPRSNSTSTNPGTNSTSTAPRSNSTSTAANSNSTSTNPGTNSTSTTPRSNSTSNNPGTNSTSTAPRSNSTSTAANSNSTSTNANSNSTSTAANSNSTSTNANLNSTSTTANSNSTSTNANSNSTSTTANSNSTSTNANSNSTSTNANSNSTSTNANSNSTSTTPRSNSTSTNANSNSTSTNANSNSTSTTPRSNSASTAANSNSTSTNPGTNSTSTTPRSNSTSTAANSNSTSTNPGTNSTSTTPRSNSTSTNPGTNSTSTAANSNSTSTTPRSNSTSTTANSNSTSTNANSNSTSTTPRSNSASTAANSNSTSTNANSNSTSTASRSNSTSTNANSNSTSTATNSNSTSTTPRSNSASTAANSNSTSTTPRSNSASTAANSNSTSTNANSNPASTAANSNSTSTTPRSNSASTAANSNSTSTTPRSNSTSTAANSNSTSTNANSNPTSTAANSNSTSTAANSNSTSTNANSNSTSTTANSNSTSTDPGTARSSSAAATSVISTATRSTACARSSSVPRPTQIPASATSTTARSASVCCRSEMPCCMSSFAASGSSSGERSTATTSGNAGSSSSRATNTATTSEVEDSFVRASRELRSRLHFFDHVKLLLRDRIRNSSEHASNDSTVDYSNIADESDEDTQSTMDSSVEDGHPPIALGPAIESMLASVNRSGDSGMSLFQNISNILSGRSSAEAIPSTSTSVAPVLGSGEPVQVNPLSGTPQTGTSTNAPGPSTQMSVRDKIRILSRHVDNMQRLCRARIEIVQLQQIRRMWEDLTAQIRTLHHAVQSRNATDPIQCPHPETRDPVNPMERLAITDNISAPGPSTAQPFRPQTARGRSSSPERFSDRFRNVVESMVNSILNDEDQSEDETEIHPRARTRRATRQQANETEEPQPGPSGLNRSSHPKRDDIQTRLYRSLRDAMKRHKRKKEAAAAAAAAAGEEAAASQNAPPRQAPRGRPRRNGRNSQDPPVLQGFPSLGSNLDFVINELESSTPNADRNASPLEPQPSTSRACQSCNQRRRIERNIARQQQKRRAAESVPTSESGVSPPKIVRTEIERRIMSFACPTIPNPGTPVEFYDIPGPAPTSTRELLRRMIQRMETMVRFQREAFRRAEETTSAPPPPPPPAHPHSSDDSDSDDTFSRQDLRSLPRDYKATRRDIVNLGRAVTQLRARRLLDYMVQSLTEFFEESANMENSFDDQVISLYTLLHLSLELTDILLEQLNATSNDLERVWGLRHVSSRPLEVRNSEIFFPEQARALRRLRERARGPSRTCIHTSIAREESRRAGQNQFLRSPSRPRLSTNQNSSRTMGHHSASPGFCRYRPSSTFSPGFRRFRRAAPRNSGAMPSGWWGFGDSPRRPSQVPRSREEQPSVIVSNRLPNDDNNTQNQVRGVRIWERRNSVDGESDFHRDLRSDNNNNSNPDLGNAGPSESGPLVAVDNSHDDGPSGSVIASTSGNPPNANSLSFSAYLNLREQRPMFWIRYGNPNEPIGPADAQSREGNFTVPVVHVNDIPVQDVSMLNQPRYRPQSPTPRGPEEMWRWRAWRPRFLHPRYSGPHTYDDQDANDVPEGVHYYRIVNTASGSNPGLYSLDPVIITDAPMSPHHRIQAWDFTQMKIPDISDREVNGVVAECKIHNDASVDVSNDGHLLVTLLPSGRFSVTTMLGVYSLDWSSLGQLLYKTSFEQNAVSVSLSPTNRHLLVGLASRPLVLRDRINMAQIFKMEGARPTPPGGTWQSGRGRLVHMRDLEQTRETSIMSLNCIRWAPGPGQGLVYGTNTGQLRVLR